MPNKIILSEDKVNNIIKLYSEGHSSYEIAKTEGVSNKFIINLLKNQNINIRAYHQINRKYHPDHSYFDFIDTEEKAYFLGYLFADGHISSKCFRVVLKLNQKDKTILEKFSNFIYGQNLVKPAPQNCYSLSFSSKQIHSKLISYGCTPRKSLTLKFPENLSPELNHHFMRGYFDGDGCICVWNYKDSPNNLEGTASIVSTKDFCNKYKEIIQSQSDIDFRFTINPKAVARGNNITTTLLTSGNINITRLYHFLYKDATIFLDRKRDKFKKIEKQTLQKNPELKDRKIILSDQQIKDICSMYCSGLSAETVSQKYNCSYNYIFKVLRDNGIAIRSISDSVRKNSINEDYFNNIDSEEKAFLLGFVFSCGMIDIRESEGNYQLYFQLPVSKRNILEKLSQIIFGEDKIKIKKDKACLLICGKNLIKKIENLKTKNQNSISIFDPQFNLSFAKGVIQGKGREFKKGNKIKCSITVNENLATQVKAILIEIGINVKQIKDTRVCIPSLQIYFDKEELKLLTI
jgi:hypothetical protein